MYKRIQWVHRIQTSIPDVREFVHHVYTGIRAHVAHEKLTREENTMGDFEKWLHEASEAIGVDYEVLEPRINDLLDLTKHVAHSPSRPAAPLTAFLVGVSAGKASGSNEDMSAKALESIKALVSIIEEKFPSSEE